ncbi:MAG: hypothetical protein PHQ89_03430 [Bacilli bacterium]|nr:hypothetical protein [Bacilli bacterium]
MKKKILGAVVSCLSIALCFSIGMGMTVVNADDGNGNGPTPRVCSHPLCWGA